MYEDGTKTVPTTFVEVIDLSRDNIGVKCKNAKLYRQTLDKKAKPAEALAARGTMRGQIDAAERQNTASKGQLADAGMVLEKLSSKTFRTEADFCAAVAAVKESLGAEKAHVKRLDRVSAAEVEKKQQLLAERRETSQTARCQLVDGVE